MSKEKDSMPEGFTSLLNNEEINKIDEEIQELQKKKQEKEEIVKYRQKIKENEVLQRNGIDTYDSKQQKVVRKSFYRLLKYSIICLLIIIIGGIIVLFFMGYQGYFKDNNTCNPTNVVECKECPIIPSCPNVSCPNCPQQVCSVNQSCIFPHEINVNLNSS